MNKHSAAFELRGAPVSEQPQRRGKADGRAFGRRRFLGASGGLAAGAALAAAGLRDAKAVSLWILAAATSGSLTTNWHSDAWFGTNALDIGAGGGTYLGLYSRIQGTGIYGDYWCTQIVESCEASQDPGQMAIRWTLSRNGDPLTAFGQCGYIHVVPYNMWVGKHDYAFATVATVGGGTTVVYFADGSLCYSGPHLHQTANGSHLADPAPSPASGGNTDYWGWWA